MNLKDAITTRRTVRKFTGHKVTDEEVTQILEAGRWAPSWANTQSWRFIVVRDTQLIEKITDQYSATNPARACSKSASVLIIGCAESGLSGCRGGKDRTKFSNWNMFDLGMATQNISLMAHDIGLGSVIVGSMNHDGIHELLDLPDNIQVIVSIPVGKPLEGVESKGKRNDLNSMTYINRFGAWFY